MLVAVVVTVTIADCNSELLEYLRCLELQTCHLQSEDWLNTSDKDFEY